MSRTFRTVPIALAFLVTSIAAMATTAQAESHLGDRAALVALYDATDGPNWKNDANWLSDKPLHTWYGVTTDGRGRIIWLDLRRNELSGEIPTELGTLPALTSLDLSDNQLSGAIPIELGGLPNLETLRLSPNPPKEGVGAVS